jgi:TRAP transporter TAXI family solute receptor
VDNVRILARGEADYAIVQSDVAAAALAGEGDFARGGAIDELRAVGALFPEAVHVVVLKDSTLRHVGDLRGKRVDLGAPESGTRFDAVAVLEAHNLSVRDLREARSEGGAPAVERLRRRQVDALFVTTPAPARLLQPLAAAPGLRLLGIDDAAIARLLVARQGLSPLTLAAHTYPRQTAPVRTVGSSALLVTLADTPDAEVANLADLVFRRMPAQYANSADLIRITPHHEHLGITIPLHPGAAVKGRQQAGR